MNGTNLRIVAIFRSDNINIFRKLQTIPKNVFKNNKIIVTPDISQPLGNDNWLLKCQSIITRRFFNLRVTIPGNSFEKNHFCE